VTRAAAGEGTARFLQALANNGFVGSGDGSAVEYPRELKDFPKVSTIDPFFRHYTYGGLASLLTDVIHSPTA
jgi:hypothetical protein